ncbi:MAG: GIY-YIG nuclease family protein [Arenicella sp.]|nr:GIY-YIG nuclease family protein [Arenicella sp.]
MSSNNNSNNSISGSNHALPKSGCSTWYVYMLRCADNSLYTGVTTDVERRVEEHNENSKKAAKYTRARRPVSLAYVETAMDRSAACKRESNIKRLPSQHKEALVDGFQASSSFTLVSSAIAQSTVKSPK